jgi:hypothetical protein
MRGFDDFDRHLLTEIGAGVGEHPDQVVRAVDGTPHVDRVSSSLAFAAFLEDCHSRLEHSLEFIDAAELDDAERKWPWLNRRPSLN